MFNGGRGPQRLKGPGPMKVKMQPSSITYFRMYRNPQRGWVFLVSVSPSKPPPWPGGTRPLLLVSQGRLNLSLSSPTGRATELYPVATSGLLPERVLFLPYDSDRTGAGLDWTVTFLGDQFHPPLLASPNSGHLPCSDFDRWGRCGKKETLSHWRGALLSDGWWWYWDLQRSHIQSFKCLHGAFHWQRCYPQPKHVFSWYSTSVLYVDCFYFSHQIHSEQCLLCLPV